MEDKRLAMRRSGFRVYVIITRHKATKREPN